MDKTMITKATIIKAIQQFLVEQNHKKSEADRKKLENANLSDKEELLKKLPTTTKNIVLMFGFQMRRLF